MTIFAGLIKLTIDRYRIKQFIKADKGKQPQTPDMLEAQPVTAASIETEDDIPFGIRAIESGIEVDGVWISRSNTPVGSSRASISDEKMARSYNNSALELPNTAMYASSRTSSQAPSSFDRAVSAERLPNTNSRSSSPTRSQTYTMRCCNCNHNIHSGRPSPRCSLGRAILWPAFTYVEPETAMHSPVLILSTARNATRGEQPRKDSNKSSRRTSDESDYMNAQDDLQMFETAHVGDPRSDLHLLQSHRMSHVAETGQLTPRVRRPGHGGEWAGVPENQISTVNGVSYFAPQKTPSPPLPAAVVDQPDFIGAATSPQPTEDARAANHARQPVRLMESYAPKAAYYPDSYQPRGPHHQYSYDEVPYEVSTEQNQRDSDVLRKVNAGFEILRPGTFQPPTPEELELAEKRQSKKLQKKRRTSGDSRQSIFVEQV